MRIEVLRAGAVFGIGGLFLSIPFFVFATGKGWFAMIPASAVAAGSAGMLTWRLFVASHGKPPRRRLVLAGLTAGVIAHPLAWYLFLVWNYFAGTTSSLGERTMNPLEAAAGALVFSVWSYFLAGWLTLPAAGALGWFCGDWIGTGRRLNS